jgi:hypothetical protein
MLSAHSCVACMASLQAEDGHDQCPACLGVEHLREAVSDNPRMNCSFMPHALRLARLAEVEGRPGLPPSGLGQIKALLQNLQPAQGVPAAAPAAAQPTYTEDDMLSTAASCSLFAEEEEQAALASQAFSQGSLGGSARGSVSGCDTVRPAVRMALARLGLDEAPVSSAPVNAFFPQAAQPSVFSLPPSEPYIAELHRCWPDSRALSQHTSDSRGLATMANADSYGLDRLAPIEPAIASLVVNRCALPSAPVPDYR